MSTKYYKIVEITAKESGRVTDIWKKVAGKDYAFLKNIYPWDFSLQVGEVW